MPAAVEMGPGHSLLVAGHAFEGRAAVLRHSGDLFFSASAPRARVLADHLTNFEHEPTLHGAEAERVQWQLIWPLAQGQGQLLPHPGRRGRRHAGRLRYDGLKGQTVLRPKDIVSVWLGATGQVEQLCIVPLPSNKGSFSWPY